jgi:predicted RNase H-like HicB family nuclease
MTSSFHLITRQEGKYYVGKILENNISSFGKTEKECIEKTKEALDLYLENTSKKDHISIKSPRLLQFEYNYA